MTGLIGDTASSNVSIMYSKGRPVKNKASILVLYKIMARFNKI